MANSIWKDSPKLLKRGGIDLGKVTQVIFLHLQPLHKHPVEKKKAFKQVPKKASTPSRASGRTNKGEETSGKKPGFDIYLVSLWVMILLVSYIRFRLRSVPFERDEGEYGYIGNLFLHGIAPFKDAYSMKLPGTSFMYSILMVIFGHTNSGVHLGMVFIIAATMYLYYNAFRKLFSPFAGLAGATIYGFMAIGFVFDGFAAHATHFICFFSSLALFFLAGFLQTGKVLKIFLCGLMLGLAFLMKQQAAFLILFAGVYLLIYLIKEKKQGFVDLIKKLFLFGSGVFIPYVILLVIIISSGEFKVFWLWTVEYASKYEGVKSWFLTNALFHSSFDGDWQVYNYFWLLALGGLLVLYWSAYSGMQKLFALLYFIASVCVVSAGFYFRAHYFLAVLPVTGLLGAIFLEFIIQQIQQRVNSLKSAYFGVAILSLFVVYTLYNNKDYFFNYSPKIVCEMTYFGNPFNEMQEISKYIKDNTNDTDKIGILGSEPEVCFYANRISATGYLYTYPLVENQPFNGIMQQQMISEIEKNKPAYLVFCNISYSWLVQPGVPRMIFDWVDKYVNDNYYPVGFADFYNNDKTRGWFMYWNDDIKNRMGQPESSISILKRKADAKI